MMAVDGVLRPGFPNQKPPPKPKKKTRKRPRENFSQQCDVIFSRLVRSGGQCVHCGSTKAIQCAHGFSRRYRAIRWDFDNAFALCAKCHMFFTYHPLEWDDWLRGRWSPEQYERLRHAALVGRRPDLKVLLASLQRLEAA